MDKQKTLYHYTSFNAIVHILDYSQECVQKDKLMDFLFGDPLNTNDKKEIMFFEKHFFTDSVISNEIKLEIERVKQESPYPFFMSLIHHQGSKWYPKNEIPMWNMYGDNSKGVRIAFNYKLLENFCNKEGYILRNCIYFNESEMREVARISRDKVKKAEKSEWHPLLRDIYSDSLFYKTKDWDYEQEYRIIVWDEGVNICTNAYNGKRYCKVPLPLECIREITIGPLADKLVTERCLKLIREKLQSLLGEESIQFDIDHSKLQIR